MILRRLRLCDFRQFRGEHEVEFAFEATRNVTLVTGVNGAGKTGLFYALNWVLYGDATALPGQLISKAAIAEDPHPSTWVQLHFLHEGREFVARRDMTRTPTGAEKETAFTLQEFKGGGRVETYPDPPAMVNVILPKDARRYFFFDGERIDELSRPGHEREVQDAVRSVLKLKVLERAVEHLTDVTREYSRSLKAQGQLDAELLRLVERVEAYTNALAERDSKLNDVRERVEILGRQLEQVRAKLDQLGEVRVLQAQERAARERRTKLEQEQAGLASTLQRAVNDASSSIAGDAIGRAIAILDTKRAKGEIPSGIRQQFIDDLIAEGTCICGRHLDEDATDALRRRHATASSTQVVDAVIRVSGELRAIASRIDGSREQLRSVMERRQSIRDDLVEVQRELENIASQRSTDFSEDVAQLEDTRKLLEGRYRDAVLEQGRLEAEIARDSKQLEMANQNISKFETKSRHGRLARRRYELASQAAQAAQRIHATFSADMRSKIQEATDTIFKSFVWKEKQFESVRVTEDYKLEVEDRFHSATLAGLSAGERQVLSLAFIAGMSRVTEEEAPIVIDTPFGRLSEMPVTSIVEQLPSIAKQLVLFVTDREMNEDSRSLIRGRVGRSYELRFDDETGATSIQGVPV